MRIACCAIIVFFQVFSINPCMAFEREYRIVISDELNIRPGPSTERDPIKGDGLKKFNYTEIQEKSANSQWGKIRVLDAWIGTFLINHETLEFKNDEAILKKVEIEKKPYKRNIKKHFQKLSLPISEELKGWLDNFNISSDQIKIIESGSKFLRVTEDGSTFIREFPRVSKVKYIANANDVFVVKDVKLVPNEYNTDIIEWTKIEITGWINLNFTNKAEDFNINDFFIINEKINSYRDERLSVLDGEVNKNEMFKVRKISSSRCAVKILRGGNYCWIPVPNSHVTKYKKHYVTDEDISRLCNDYNSIYFGREVEKQCRFGDWKANQKTANGNPILYRLVNYPSTFNTMVICGHHGDEDTSRWCFELYNKISKEKLDGGVIIVPMANPDGIIGCNADIEKRSQRTNCSNVDLNRNLPTTIWYDKAEDSL